MAQGTRGVLTPGCCRSSLAPQARQGGGVSLPLARLGRVFTASALETEGEERAGP